MRTGLERLEGLVYHRRKKKAAPSPSIPVPVVHFHLDAPAGGTQNSFRFTAGPLCSRHTTYQTHGTQQKQSAEPTQRRPLPVVVPVAQRPDGDFEGLPHRVQGVLHHLRLVADGEPETQRKKNE